MTEDSPAALGVLHSGGTTGLEDDGFTPTSERGPRVVRDKSSQYPTSPMERFLILMTIVILPLQDHFPAVAGFSIMAIVFAVLAAYVLLNRPGSLAKIWSHPALLSAFGLLFVAAWIESLHPYSSYSEILRIAQMIVGAFFVASMCRDRRALRAAVYGYILMGIWLSFYLVMTAYGPLRGTAVRGFDDASLARASVNRTASMHANLNNIAAQILPGMAAALALALTAGKPKKRYLLFGIAAFCAVASFLTMSRGGAVGVIIVCSAVMFASGLRSGKMILAGGVLAAVIAMAVPDVVWQRMQFSTETSEGRQEVRARIYTAAIEHFPEYALMGVGAGNFAASWGTFHGFHSNYPGSGVIRAHNAFFQATINWGLPCLLLVLVMMWKAYRCLPKKRGPDALRLCLLGIAVSCLLLLLVRDSLYDKEYSLLLGLLVGAQHWIWQVPLSRFQTAKRSRLS